MHQITVINTDSVVDIWQQLMLLIIVSVATLPNNDFQFKTDQSKSPHTKLQSV